MTLASRLRSVSRAGLLLSAVALLPVATAGLATVDAQAGPEFGRLYTVYQLIKSR